MTSPPSIQAAEWLLPLNPDALMSLEVKVKSGKKHAVINDITPFVTPWPLGSPERNHAACCCSLWRALIVQFRAEPAVPVPFVLAWPLSDEE